MKGQFPEIDEAVFTFFQERRKTGLFVSYVLLHEEAIRKAKSFNILRAVLKPVNAGPYVYTPNGAGVAA
jgi:hypothetical protein